MTSTEELQRELDQWKQAVTDAQTTRRWLEERGDRKTRRIRQLEAQVRELGGTP